MKQILLPIAIFMMAASSKNSAAQNSAIALIQPDIATIIPGNLKASSLNNKTGKTKAQNKHSKILRDIHLSSKNVAETKVTGINIRAVRDFNYSYNMQEARWFESEGGYFASFFSNGMHTKVVYDSKGRRFYTLISYTEAYLDRYIRHLVMSKYYDGAIIGVHQFEFDNKTVYLIKMQDSQFKPVTLKVCDGLIEDITMLDKK